MLFSSLAARRRLCVRLLATVSVAALPAPLMAQARPPVPAAAAAPAPARPVLAPDAPADDFHDIILVRSPGIERLDIVAGTSVVTGLELQRNMNAQIGEVLEGLPGVTASGFAPGASRPILRGFGGERIRVLTDGIGVIDASTSSDDHAVSVDPLIASRIEVLRGPAVLLYGNQAIGGAVNVVTKRIPPAPLDHPVHVDAMVAADTVNRGREAAMSLDFAAKENLVFHVDGSFRQTDDLRIPGFVASEALRADLFERAEEEEIEGDLEEAQKLRDGANTRGILPNSAVRTHSLGAGVGFFSGNSSFGLSYDYYDTFYGIPGIHGVGHIHPESGDPHHGEHGGEVHGGHDAHEEDKDISIGMRRHRVDFKGIVDLGTSIFDRVETRWGYSNYTHTEFKGDETGTVFDVEGVEGRVELVQTRRANWGGVTGMQFSSVDFAALGDEAFIPAHNTQNIALFTVQELDFDRLGIEVGGRYENVAVDATTSLGTRRDFDTFSASTGVSYGIGGDDLGDARIGMIASRTERAPSGQELFANGAHLATQQFKIGNAELDNERSVGLEGYLRGALGPASLTASVYHNWFDGFIFLAETGQSAGGLEVYEFRQEDARHFGLEGQIAMPVYQNDDFSLRADLRADYTRATLDAGGAVPRIPPVSLSGALEGQVGAVNARAEVRHFSRQDRVGEHETPTDAFTMFNLALAWNPVPQNANLTVMLQADNIFNAEGRRHASFTKEFVPLAGRNIRLSVRTSL